MTRNLIAWLVVLGLTAGALARDVTLIDESFEGGLGTWTLMTQPLQEITDYNDTPVLFPADGTGILGPNTGYPGTKSAGFTGSLPIPDGTTVEWICRRFPTAVAPGTRVILSLEVDRYVFDSTATGDYAFCNRIYVLTNTLYDHPLFTCHGGSDGTDPLTTGDGARSSVWNHETGSGTKPGGQWKHTSWTDATNKVFTSQNGSIEVRLVQYGSQPSGDLTTAWDNLHVVLKDYSTGVPGAELWRLDEDFEAYDDATNPLTDTWTRVLYPPEDPARPRNDTPIVFAPDDPLLYANTGNPGTHSAGYSSDLLYTDPTTVEWLQQQFPALVAPGTYPIHVEFDRYVYKDQAVVDDRWAVANRVYLLTNELYDNPSWDIWNSDPDPVTTNDGHRLVVWNGDDDGNWTRNGIWEHVVFDDNLTTETGDLEVRLSIADRFGGAQAVAWDNVQLTLTLPCNDPRFDADGDGDVDGGDFGAFQACLTGSGATEILDGCRCMNSNGDTAIDSIDLGVFEGCASGPGIVAPAEGTGTCTPSSPP
ncbi:MAG: hypothetical protein JXA14_07610 [Anaerolineae bacterium]|nr:hypothetical protein [Anaerolineae bacterium]